MSPKTPNGSSYVWMNQYEYVDGENMKNGLDSGLKWLVAMATQQNKYDILFSFTWMTFMDFDSNDVSDDGGQRLFAAFQLFWSSKRASIRKPLLASLKSGLLRRIPKTNLKRILQRMMEAMVKTCTGLKHPSIPSGGVSPIVYVYPWNLAHPRLKRRCCRGQHLQPLPEGHASCTESQKTVEPRQ